MPKPDVYVYLDEFERGNIFALGALIVPVDIASQLTADWDALRKEIKQFLLANYPDAKSHPLLRGNLLPEIHTVDLFQSKGYYRKYRRGRENKSDRYWLQHYSWIEQGLELINRYDLRFIPFPADKKLYVEMSELIRLLFNDIFEHIDKQSRPTGRMIYSRAKFSSLSSNFYLLALSQALAHVEAYLGRENLFGEIICDDHEMSKGFSTTRVIDWLRQNKTYKALENPRFASGLDESLLQASDVLCYVSGQGAYASSNSGILKEPLNEWQNTFLDNALPGSIFGRTKLEHGVIILCELISEMCIYDATVRNQVIERLRYLYKKIY